MARTDVTTQAMVLPGLDPVLSAPVADGDIVDVGRNFLYVDNGSVAPITVTVQTPGGVADLALEDRTVAVPAGEFRLIPLTMAAYKRPVGGTDAGRAWVDYSAVADVTRAVVSL